MKKQKNQRSTVDSIEAIKDIPNEVKKTVGDTGKAAMHDLWDQLLGKDHEEHTQQSGDLKQGEELDLRKREQVQHVEPAIDYAREILHAERNIRARDSQEIKVRIQEIQVELKKITKTSKELEIEFKDVTMETLPASPGKLHLNFFEWVLSQLRRARMRIEDSARWTSTMKSKKSQKQYWSLFKKHGTSFGLSAERYQVTQTG